jgi:hypothetical protein
VLARRLAAWLGLAVLVGPLAACNREWGGAAAEAEADDEARAKDLRERMDDVLPHFEVMAPSLPADRNGILRELAPLPSDALLVVYEVEGPGGVTGSLEVLARPGGWRRENWTIQVPLGEEGTRQLDGSTVQTPDGVWIEGSDAPPAPSPLGALAEAWLALPEASQLAVIEELRAHRQALARARAAEAAPSERILDLPCHVTRVATIELCLWEAAGLPLRYASDGLRLRAIHIDERAGIGEHAFDPPTSAHAAVEGVAGLDAAAVLQRAAEGDLTELAPWLHPGLRLPS